jgi:prepilin-type N-terminal cleavage/methylation domain-containing protein
MLYHFTKNSTGFSLVEIIVTSVIIAILAVVAIPLYSGYLRDQRQSTVNNLAQTAAAAGNAYWRRTGANLTSADLLPQSTNLSLYYDNSSSGYSMSLSGNMVRVNDVGHSPINGRANYR